ncbi:MAG: glycoside hydrolase family 28 protein [Prevotella sp.]|nr:glycoside hydrolase family 28 protein [Prevotella sp.]
MTTRNYLLLLTLLLSTTMQAGDYAKYYQNLPTKVKQVVPIQTPQNEVSLTDFGAVGDGVTLCTDAFRKGIDELTKRGGGRLNVPDGVWLTGPILLKSDIELHLDKNAIIYFSPDKRLFVDQDEKAKRVYPCIRASKAKNIAITGQGIIDGNGQQWRPVKRGKMSDVEWKQYTEMGGQVTEKGDLWYPWQLKSGYADIAATPAKQEAMRNDLLRIEQCENILLSGVTFQNSPRFHVHPCYCRNIIIDGITVRCPWNVQNGDGIDLSDCHQALIVNSTVNVGDDGLCMKSGSQKKNCDVWGVQDVLIQDNTVYHAHGGFVLGSETTGGIRDMVVRRNRFLGTDVGLRFKSGLGRGGKTERMYISDIMMADIKDQAIIFQCDYVNRHAGDDGKEPVITEEMRRLAPNFQDIHISRIVCRGTHTGIKAAGIKGMDCIHDISISDCSIIYNKVAQQIDESTAKLKLTNVSMSRP